MLICALSLQCQARCFPFSSLICTVQYYIRVVLLFSSQLSKRQHNNCISQKRHKRNNEGSVLSLLDMFSVSSLPCKHCLYTTNVHCMYSTFTDYESGYSAFVFRGYLRVTLSMTMFPAYPIEDLYMHSRLMINILSR